LHRRVAHWRRMRHQRSIRRCLANNNNAMRTLPIIKFLSNFFQKVRGGWGEAPRSKTKNQFKQILPHRAKRGARERSRIGLCPM
ncbi:MAG: hypothetical protein FWF81_10790, partial [Defluviitaleaceae bacterium]|nr:hypothetical protein [Defluviitaleaceae bacterium]